MSIARSFIIFSLIILKTFTFVPNAVAVITPTFPDCVNPQGTLKVSYSEGTHGIVGDGATYTGSDAVYTLSEDTLTQCFCADNGNGIQSNWYRVSALSDQDIQVLKNQGWLYVPNGALWGLLEAPYMVQNSAYSCSGGTGGGEILSASTTASDVLGLASTGNIVTIYGVIGIGLISLVLSMILRKRSSR